MTKPDVHFQTALDELKEEIRRMGDKVERSITLAVQCRLSQNGSLWPELLTLESEIHTYERNIDAIALQLHARHPAKTAHLRRLTACMKINSSLSLIGSLSTRIADQSMTLGRSKIPLPVNLPQVGGYVSGMIQGAVVCFVDEDVDLAEAVSEMAHTLSLKIGETSIHLASTMRTSPEFNDQAIGMLLAVKSLERVGEYAAHIANDVLFWICGTDARCRA